MAKRSLLLGILSLGGEPCGRNELCVPVYQLFGKSGSLLRWELVTNALRNSSYGSVEEFAKLPPDVQRAVGSPNMLRTWAAMNFSELQTVVASNFKRDYRAIIAQKKDFAKIPESVKQIAAAKNLIEGQNGQ